MDIADSHVLYRNLSGKMPVMVRGNNSYLIDSEGKKYLDMSSSACCAILGHSNFSVRHAIEGQLNMVPNVFGGFWASPTSEAAGDIIARQLGDWFGRVIFQNGGGEAVDLACKLAAQYHAEGGSQKDQFITLDHAFHGVGLLPFSLTGSYPRYALIENYQTATRDNYILRSDHSYNVGVPAALIDARKWFSLIGLNTSVAAVIVEPVSGPQLGAYPHAKEYLQGLRDLCDETDTLLIFDEIICGSGRCGYLSMADMYGVYPDITLLGKGFSAGYVPMSAICLSKKVVDRLKSGSGTVMFGTTNSAHTTGCAAVLATLKYMHDYKLYEHVQNESDALRTLIEELLTVPGVSEIRGCGYLFGLVLKDPRTGSWLPPNLAFHAIARKQIMKNGVIVYTKGQTMYGGGDFITIAPPVETSPADLEHGIDMIKIGLQQAFALINRKV